MNCQMNNAILGPQDPMLPRLKEDIRNAKEICLLVSFLMESGVELVIDELESKANQGIPIRIITGTYLNVTEPGALFMLKDRLGAILDLRIYADNSLSFHPKAYFIDSEDERVVYVGSSNLSRSALKSGIEWNYRLTEDNDIESYRSFRAEYGRVTNIGSVEATLERIRDYAKKYVKPSFARRQSEIAIDKECASPRGVQYEALLELRLARKEGVQKGLVVAATGVGKTFLAAFDSRGFEKILFVAHREEIIRQAKKTFAKVHQEKSVGILNGTSKDMNNDVIVASIQTLSKAIKRKNFFPKDKFDYIVVDEFHHAGAETYRQVINYFEPKFLLGLTATPYRMDNQDILALCDDNLIYQVDIRSAINRDILCPFEYYGVYDETNYEPITYTNGKYVEKELEKTFLNSSNRDVLILNEYQKRAGRRSVAFCSSIAYAEHLAKLFSDNDISSCAVHSGEKNDLTKKRTDALEELENGDLKIIFTVDIFNEGVDIPSLDTVLFLRPTESYTVFMQQLGRGLRKHPDKKALTVLDFIGNYKKAYYKPILLSGELPNKGTIGRDYDTHKLKEAPLPYGCQMYIDLQVLDLFVEQAKRDKFGSRLSSEYFRLKMIYGRRPTRMEIYLGSDLKTSQFLRAGYLSFLKKNGEQLSDWEQDILGTPIEEFLQKMEKTSMSKSYKIPIYYALIRSGGWISEAELVQEFYEYFLGNLVHFADLPSNAQKAWDLNKAKSIAYNNPIKYLSAGRDRQFFTFDKETGEFGFCKMILDAWNTELCNHIQDIAEYKELTYFARNRDKQRS